VTSAPHPGEVSAGPLPSRSQAQAAAAAARAAFALRSCRPALPEDDGSCLAGLLGRCAAPCRGGANVDAYAAAVARAAAWLRGEEGSDPVAGQRARMAALAAERRFEEAAQLRDQLDALEGVRTALARLRRAAAREGVLLAADVDDRFVQAFACTGGRIVGRRRLPRGGDAALESVPLLAALDAARSRPLAPLGADEADIAHVVAAAFARPGRDVAAVPSAGRAERDLVAAVGTARRRVPLRR